MVQTELFDKTVAGILKVIKTSYMSFDLACITRQYTTYLHLNYLIEYALYNMQNNTNLIVCYIWYSMHYASTQT